MFLLTFERKNPDFDSIFFKFEMFKSHKISMAHYLTQCKLIQKPTVLLKVPIHELNSLPFAALRPYALNK